MPTSPKPLVDVLEGFNRKERNLLVREILGHRQSSLRLSAPFLHQLREKTGLNLASDPWWATDLHIDWLVAAVMLFTGQTETDTPRNDGDLTTATQEDFDLVVADDKHLILIEAKAHEAWSQEQFDRKLKRYEQLRSLAGERLKVRLLLMSRTKSERLAVPPACEVAWLSFDIGTSLTSYRVTRCDAQGTIGKGDHWKVLEKPASDPTGAAELETGRSRQPLPSNPVVGMDSFQHRPWIPSNFGGDRIAILGYSHYLGEGGRDHEDMTESMLRSLVFGPTQNDYGVSDRTPFFAKIARCFGRSVLEFWNDVIFLNFVPQAIGGEDNKFDWASHDQAVNAAARLFKVLKENRVEKLFVFSSKAWESLPDTVAPRDVALSPTNPYGFNLFVDAPGTIAFHLRHPQFASPDQIAHLQDAVTLAMSRGRDFASEVRGPNYKPS